MWMLLGRERAKANHLPLLADLRRMPMPLNRSMALGWKTSARGTDLLAIFWTDYINESKSGSVWKAFCLRQFMRQSHRYPNRCHLEVHAAVCLGMGVGVRQSTRSPMSPSSHVSGKSGSFQSYTGRPPWIPCDHGTYPINCFGIPYPYVPYVLYVIIIFCYYYILYVPLFGPIWCLYITSPICSMVGYKSPSLCGWIPLNLVPPGQVTQDSLSTSEIPKKSDRIALANLSTKFHCLFTYTYIFISISISISI